MPRHEWYWEYPAQAILVIDQQEWTKDTEVCTVPHFHPRFSNHSIVDLLFGLVRFALSPGQLLLQRSSFSKPVWTDLHHQTGAGGLWVRLHTSAAVQAKGVQKQTTTPGPVGKKNVPPVSTAPQACPLTLVKISLCISSTVSSGSRPSVLFLIAFFLSPQNWGGPQGTFPLLRTALCPSLLGKFRHNLAKSGDIGSNGIHGQVNIHVTQPRVLCFDSRILNI